MKKILSLVVSGALLLSASACSTYGTGTGNNRTGTNQGNGIGTRTGVNQGIGSRMNGSINTRPEMGTAQGLRTTDQGVIITTNPGVDLAKKAKKAKKANPHRRNINPTMK